MDAATISSPVERLRRTLTWCERLALGLALEALGGDEGVLCASRVVGSVGVSKTNVTTALRLAEVAGVLISRSMGSKGTYVRILDRAALEEVLNGG